MRRLTQKEITQQVIWKLATSPSTIGPVTLGATFLIVSVAGSSFLKFAALGGIFLALGAGICATRYILNGEDLAKKAAEAIEQENEEERNETLDKLYLTLSKDGDSRTHRLMNDLRKITSNFKEGRKDWNDLNLSAYTEVAAKIDKLFIQAIKDLETSESLLRSAKGLSSESAKQPIVDRREGIIGNVEKSLEVISNTLIKVEELRAKEIANGGKSALEDMSEDLERSIDVAIAVEQRMNGDSRDYSEAEFLQASKS